VVDKLIKKNDSDRPNISLYLWVDWVDCNWDLIYLETM
jgi:hypothetical protein